MKSYDTLTEALNDLKKRGYTADFNLYPNWIECRSLDIWLKPEEFHVDEVYRFEGLNNPDDSAVLFAVRSTSGIRGTLLDAYGVYATAMSPTMMKKLTIDNTTEH
jgi:hypothetical protein